MSGMDSFDDPAITQAKNGSKTSPTFIFPGFSPMEISQITHHLDDALKAYRQTNGHSISPFITDLEIEDCRIGFFIENGNGVHQIVAGKFAKEVTDEKKPGLHAPFRFLRRLS